MELICYPLLSTVSKRTMRRRWRRKRYEPKQPYHYVPQYRLVQRLMQETGLSEKSVKKQIRDERFWLLQEDYGTDTITSADV